MHSAPERVTATSLRLRLRRSRRREAPQLRVGPRFAFSDWAVGAKTDGAEMTSSAQAPAALPRSGCWGPHALPSLASFLPLPSPPPRRSAPWRDSALRAPGEAPRSPPPLQASSSEHFPVLSRSSSPSVSQPVASRPSFRAL